MKLNLPLLIAAVLIVSCTKNDQPSDNPTDPPVISSISPTHGPRNTVDTILGSNFSTTTTKNEVAFNGKPATVISAAADRLIVKVPDAAGEGQVTVTVNGRMAGGPQFRYEAFSVSVFAGMGYMGALDGTGTRASIATPVSMATDSSGNLYVVELGNNIIRKITPGAVVTRFAGVIGIQGTADGPALHATFKYAYSVCTDRSGNVYVGDVDAVNVRKISGGVVSIYATGATPIISGVRPTGMIFDTSGSLLCVGPFSDWVRIITAAGKPEFIKMNESIGELWGITFDSQGEIIVSDKNNHVIRKVLRDGTSTIIAGQMYTPGSTDGKGAAALFNMPKSLVTDKAGNIYVADQGNNAIRKISPDGTVSTLLSNISRYTLDGGGFFSGAWGLCIDKNNILYIANTGESTILKVVFE